MRALQLKRQQEGITLMPSAETPSMPNWDDKLSLPPSFEEYLTEKEKQKEEEKE